MKKILVLCTGNSARSQMAQGYLQYFADTAGRGDRAQVYSAGVGRHGVNPLAIQAMAEDGIDISHHTARRPGSNHADEYVQIPFDYVITVCENARRGLARQQCPYFPTAGEMIHHSFPDPGHTASADRPGEDQLTSFRRVRDLIKTYSQDLIASRLGEAVPQ